MNLTIPTTFLENEGVSFWTTMSCKRTGPLLRNACVFAVQTLPLRLPISILLPLPFSKKPNYSLNDLSNRSSSATIQDPAAVNTRSTVSPLRRQLSQTMSIDPDRSISRDISMHSIPLYNVDNRSTQSVSSIRDQSSMPPLSGRPFRMRTSLTPQPLQQPREASEPPAFSALHSNPVFVRAPSQPLTQTSESQANPSVTTLGSLVGSQRSSRPPIRQHSSLLFGTPPPTGTPEAANAEKVLRELDFYKTPLVPTRIRSKMSKQSSNGPAASNITDMFSRKHALVLMGDHDRPSKKDRKKEKAKEANRTKPYAGTGGIKKRLAKARGTPEPEAQTIADVKDAGDDITLEATSASVPASAAEIPPPPPPQEKDNFSVNRAPSTNGPQTSSLRVGRAPRSHLSRPPRTNNRSSKFSAAFEEEDDISEESRKDMEMLEEAAKRAPVFEVPAGFQFPEVKPAEEPTANAKEPPITSLPFSLAKSATFTVTSDVPAAPVPGKATPEPVPGVSTPFMSAASESSATSFTETTAPAKVPDFFSRRAAPLTPPAETTGPSQAATSENKVPDSFSRQAAPIIPVSVPSSTAENGEGAGAETTKVPNFFGSSKYLAVPGSAGSATSTVPPFAAPTEAAPTPAPSTPFSFGAPATAQNTEDKESAAPEAFSFGAPQAEPTPGSAEAPKAFSFGAPKAKSTSGSASSPFNFGKQSDAPSSSAIASTATPSEEAKKTESQSFSFGQPQSSAQSASAAPFSFGKPADTPSTPSASPFNFAASTTTEPVQKSFQFGAPSSSTAPVTGSLFGNGNTTTKSGAPASSTGFSFGQPSASTNGTTSLLFDATGGSTEPAKPSSFLFGQPQKEEQPKTSPFETSSNAGNQSTSFSFGGSSTGQATSSPFSFGGGTSTSSTDSSKPFSFGAPATARPVTPPNHDQEIRMDESPTRDLNPTESKPSVGFSFGGSSAPAPLFGQGSSTSSSTTPASTGFGFGMSNGASSNPFGGMKSDDKPEAAKPFSSGGFGQSSSSSPFAFGSSKAPENDSARPATAGGFGSGASSFTFGSNNNSNPFGQSSGSAPASPSTFSQPSASFTFGSSSSTNNSNPFAFGSPAASPATPNTALPSGGFGSSFGAAATPTTPTFGAAGSTPSGGGNLFTIGANACTVTWGCRGPPH
ncbi:hypothetical protein D9758_001750 [Tetrapyrgos nigripes]|uniref:Uncharacterized protein n=1 Tax=Tetrapyrgos nigripes TaxID=182062 RepID=A0A8H5LWQ6_9AGAR|nr:hypothetical protein D9758_001750 [Tetrapyrgos nigripes]